MVYKTFASLFESQGVHVHFIFAFYRNNALLTTRKFNSRAVVTEEKKDFSIWYK